MISKKLIKKLIDEVEVKYELCWKFLSQLRNGEKSATLSNDFLNFQPTLTSALFQLDEMYRVLAQQQNQTIAKKNQLSQNWFKHRMKTLRSYQKIIKEIIAIGKALGDSFAWVFYQSERQFLKKHYEHEQTPHTPPGIGGWGELEFIRNVKLVHNQFVLYHGITTFLRIGDVSLIDLKTLRVNAIGDLKTKETEDGNRQIVLYMVIPDSSLENIPDLPEYSESDHLKKLPLALKERLNKQIKKMGESFAQNVPKEILEVRNDSHIPKLQKLATRLKQSNIAYEKAGESLILVGFRINNGKSLSSKILGNSKINYQKRLKDLVKYATQIIDISQVNAANNSNSFFVGHLNFDIPFGSKPLYWWVEEVETEFIREFIFHDVHITTLYNPAHLIRKLRELNFIVEIKNGGRKIKVSKVIGKAKFEIAGMNYFLNLIQRNLVHEDLIISMFVELLNKFQSGDVQPSAIIDLDIRLY